MDIRLKSKKAAMLLCIVMLYMWTVSLFAAVDVIKHTRYIDKNYYFTSSAFMNEMELFSKLFIRYHVTMKNYTSLSPKDKIGTESYNKVKNSYDRDMGLKEAGLMQSYAGRIELAQQSGDVQTAALWQEERDRSIAEARKASVQAMEEAVAKQTAVKDEEYAELKHSLDIRSGSIQYFIRDVKTGESYTNLTPAPTTVGELQGSTAYREAMTQVELPLKGNPNNRWLGVSQAFAMNQLEGVLLVSSTAGSGISKFQSDYAYFLHIRERIVQELILGVVCFAAGVGLFLYLRKYGEAGAMLTETRAWVKAKVPVDVRAAICFLLFLIPLLNGLDEPFFYLPVTGGQFIHLTLSAVLLGLVLHHLAESVRWLQPPRRAELKREWDRSLIRSWYRIGTESWMHKGLLFKLLCFMGMTLLLGILVGLMLEDSGPPNEYALVTFVYGIVYLAVVVPLVLKFIAGFNRIVQGAEQLASGRLEADLSGQGGSQLSRLAHHINHMKDGFQQALEDRMKSERMKSELITNVSHDLKTPLTSIINYVNLLKRESLTPEETRQYIEVLDRKTDRLKVLIDDLFEASRMASGSVELHFEKVDVVALMHQALAEFSDKIEEASLTFRVHAAEPHLYARLDGKKTWRLFENLISNAVKYALAGTRVHITLDGRQELVEIRMQNVSAYEIDFDAEELFERFKRGDQSRQTEGSGLGLAIAKSIVELQGGELRIEVDGDQFKVIVQFHKA